MGPISNDSLSLREKEKTDRGREDYHIKTETEVELC